MQIDKITEVVEAVEGIADEVSTTDEEERTLLSQIHAEDMRSDSWLSKNIRPLFLVFSCFSYIMLLVGEMFGYVASVTLVKVIESWGTVAVMFYFGSRGWQHVEKTKQKSKIVEARIKRKEIKQEERLKRREKLRDKLTEIFK